MKARSITATLTVTLAALVAGCASSANTASTTASTASHDMAAMPGHDMSAMSSHSSSETAFLFPDGDDKGWSKVENGSQHTMAPEIHLANLPAATRIELLRQLALTMDVIK